MPISLFDCALLAEDAYEEFCTLSASSHGWSRIDGRNWSDGFAAETYRSSDGIIIAYRGTDDLQDALDDARMTPLAPRERLLSVVPELLNAYGMRGHPEMESLGHVIASIMDRPDVRSAVAVGANQLPQNQVQAALDYCDAAEAPPSYVVGHSLGGALAKTVSQRRSIPAIGFNSPNMGNLRGIRAESSYQILSINAFGDPLSLATRSAGNLPLGMEIIVSVPPYPQRPPQRPVMASYTHPVSCPRSHTTSYTNSRGLLQHAASALCQATESVGRLASLPERTWNMLSQYPDYYRHLATYMGELLLHHHSIATLRETLAGNPRFLRPLNENFENA